MNAAASLLVRGGAAAGLALSRRRRRVLANGVDAQMALLADLVDGYARCSDGQAHGLRPGAAYEEFRRRMPLRTYEGFAAPIADMLRGGRNILWPGRCDHFAVSSGTTAGRTKYLPVNEAMVAHFRATGLESLFLASERSGTRLFTGKHLFLGGATALEKLQRPTGLPDGFSGDLSGITAQRMPAWAERLLYEPGREIASVADWPRKIALIVERCLRADITLLAGIPSWILVLAESLQRRASEQGLAAPTLRSLWPNLRCLVHGGVPIEPYLQELGATVGEGVLFHEVYPASEGFIAAQDGERAAGLRLFADAGIFYEFLPLADYVEAQLDTLGAKAVPLEGVRPGLDYVLVMSTPAGLSRYVIGDVVRFTSTDVPRLVYSGRTRLQLSAFGEHVIERELTETIAARFSGRGLQVANFHVAPVFVDHASGITRGRHEWWIALRPGGVPQDPAVLAVELDEELAHRNDDYAAKRAGGGMELPLVRLVRPELFETWQKSVGKWGGQSKMPRCRSDREVADALAKLEHNHRLCEYRVLE